MNRNYLVYLTALLVIPMVSLAGCAVKSMERRMPPAPNIVLAPSQPSLEEIVGISPSIFTGTLVGLRYGYHESTGPNEPYTFVRFGGLEFIRGSDLVPIDKDGTLEISHIGGIRKDMIGLEVSEQPQFELGKRYLVFLRGGGWRLSPIAGGQMGYFQLWGETKGDAYILDPDGTPLVGFENGYRVFAERKSLGSVHVGRMDQVEEKEINVEQAKRMRFIPERPLTQQEVDSLEAHEREREKDIEKFSEEPDQPDLIIQRWEKVMKLSDLKREIKSLVKKTEGKYPEFQKIYLAPVAMPEEGFRTLPFRKE